VEKIGQWKRENGRNPVLVVIVSGNDKASELFVRKKKEFGGKIGVEVKVSDVKEWSTERLGDFLLGLGKDGGVDGVFCQLPMGKKFLQDQKKILDLIPEDKDVDCLGRGRMGRFEEGGLDVIPSVVRAVGWVLEDFRNLSVGVLGAKGYMGRMMVIGLKNRGVENILKVDERDFEEKKEKLKRMGVVISCVGKPGLVTKEIIKEGAVLVDIGTAMVDGKVVGDVDFDSVFGKAKLVTAVPGGVGPLTVMALFCNLLKLLDGK